jgi:hypothetical protein
MEKVRRIVIIQKDLYEQIRAMAQGNIDRYQRKSCMFSKKPVARGRASQAAKAGESTSPLG